MTLPSQDEKLALAAYLESHSNFTLPAKAGDVNQALLALDHDCLDHSLKPNAATKATSILSQYTRLKRYFHNAILGLIVISFIVGLLVTPGSFLANEQKHINIYWLLLTLLGLHFINLIIWFMSLLWLNLKSTSNKHSLLLEGLTFFHHKVSQWLMIDVQISKAFWHWQSSAKSQTWLASSLSHGAWLSYLCAGLLMTLLLLLTNQVSFIWETTLLSDSRFLALTQWLSAPLAWLGLDLPTQADILSSRIDQTLQSQATRQHWANFLLASLLVYGILPRLVLLIFCAGLYRISHMRRSRSPQEDIILNRYTQHETHQKRIVDADQHAPLTSHFANNKQLSDCVIEENSLWGLYEWSDQIPDSLNKTHVHLVNDHSQQLAFCTLVEGKTSYLLVNNRLSPDRGTKRFLSDLATQHGHFQLVLASNQGGSFDSAWLNLARQLQIADPQYLPEE